MNETPPQQESTASQIAKLRTLQEEAEATFDGEKAGEIVKQIKALESAIPKVGAEESPSVMVRLREAQKEGNPDDVVAVQAEADAFYATPKPSEVPHPETAPVLHDAHVELKNETLRNDFLDTDKFTHFAGSFYKISNSVLERIVKEPEVTSYKTQDFKDEERRKILSDINELPERFEWNCIPGQEGLAMYARAFGISDEEMKAKAFQRLKEPFVQKGFKAELFDVLISTEDAESKRQKIVELISKPSTNPGNY